MTNNTTYPEIRKDKLNMISFIGIKLIARELSDELNLLFPDWVALD